MPCSTLQMPMYIAQVDLMLLGAEVAQPLTSTAGWISHLKVTRVIATAEVVITQSLTCQGHMTRHLGGHRTEPGRRNITPQGHRRRC